MTTQKNKPATCAWYSAEWWRYENPLRGAERRVINGVTQQLEHKISDGLPGDRGSSVDFTTKEKAFAYAIKNNITLIHVEE